MAKHTINVAVLGDAKSFTKTMQTAEGAAKKFGTGMGKVGKTLGLGVAGIATAGAAWVGSTARDMARVETLGARTDSVLKSTGGAAGRTADQIDTLAGSIEEMSGVEAESVTEGQNLLLTFTNIKGQNFDRATKTMTDMAVAMNGGSVAGADMKATSIQLGKALNDPVKGVSALSKVGVSFTAQQKKQIEAMVKAGDTAGAQGVIMDELGKEFGGAAEAAGNTASGGMAKLQNSFGNMSEEVLAGVLPAVTDLSGWLLRDGLPAMKSFAGWVVTNVVPVLKSLGRWIQTDVLPALSKLGAWIQTVVLPALGRLGAWIKVNVLPTLRDLAGWITGTLLPVLFRLGAWILTNVIPPMVKIYVWVARKVVPIIRSLASWVGGTMIPMLVRMGKTIGSAFSTVLGAVTRAIGWVRALPARASAALRAVPTILRTRGTQLIQGLLNGIKTKALAVWSWMTGLASTVKTKIGDLGATIKAKGTALLGGLLTGITTKATEVWSFFTGLPGKIGTTVGDLGNTLKSAGTAVLEGFWNGLKSKWEDVKGWLGDITSKIPDWKGPPVRDAKLLHGAGQLVLTGFIKGLADQETALRAQLARVTDLVGATTMPALTVAPLTGPKLARLAGPGTSGGGTVQQHIHLHTYTRPTAEDGRRIAAALRAYQGVSRV